jgi:hypothetical protein
MTIMKNITEDSLPKKSEIDDMWLELFRVHNRGNETNLEAIEIMALKMFLKEACRPQGALSKLPFNLKPKESYNAFGQHIADIINEKIDNINHMDKLNNILYSTSSRK